MTFHGLPWPSMTSRAFVFLSSRLRSLPVRSTQPAPSCSPSALDNSHARIWRSAHSPFLTCSARCSPRARARPSRRPDNYGPTPRRRCGTIALSSPPPTAHRPPPAGRHTCTLIDPPPCAPPAPSITFAPGPLCSVPQHEDGGSPNRTDAGRTPGDGLRAARHALSVRGAR